MRSKEERVLVTFLVQDLPYGAGETASFPKSKAEALIKSRKCMDAKKYAAKKEAEDKAKAAQDAKDQAAKDKYAREKAERREAAKKRALEGAENAGAPAGAVTK